MAIHVLKQEGIEGVGDGASGAVEVSASDRKEGSLRVQNATGTGSTLDSWLEHSPDGVHWTSLVKAHNQGLFRRMTATGIDSVSITKFARYIRAAWTVGGTDATFSFEVTLSG